MVDERESPSAGWRTVYREMAADANVEEPIHSCPDCGRACENVLRDVYECEEHGVFRASGDGSDGDPANAGEAEESPADESDEVESRAREPAD